VSYSRKDDLLFRFNLQQVLNFRRQNEQTKEFELAQARRFLEQEEDRLAFFMDRRGQYQREWLDRQKKGIGSAEMGIYEAYMQFIKEKITWQIEAVETAKKHVEAKKEEVLAARKDRKILDRLRSRRYKAFLAHSKREEMKHFDEVSIGRFELRSRDKRE
jgi:flagellar FliJ protein